MLGDVRLGQDEAGLDDWSGAVFAGYEVEGKLGSGGMGVVYKARHTRLDRFVALKVLRGDKTADATVRQRFLQEARTASALNHPNIVTIHDIVVNEGNDCIVMEYLEGTALETLIQPPGMPWRKAVAFARQIADALAATHGKGIVHRDLKPSNVIVTERRLVKVLDFGLAKLKASSGPGSLFDDAETKLTNPGSLIGTPQYMSPERIRGKEGDERSDLFSLGIILFEMLAGTHPFARETRMETLAAILRDEVPPLATTDPPIPARLEELIRECLEKDPGARSPSAEMLHDELTELQSTPATDTATTLEVDGAALPGRDSPAELTAVTGQAPLPQQPATPTVVVLPFVDMSPEGDQEYFCDGITEELINVLSKVDGLNVISRTSAFQFKGKGVDIRTIGRELGATMVLESSLRKAGDQLRMTARLGNVADGCEMWSERFDRRLEDVFAVQDEIARTIVEKVKFRLVSNTTEFVRPEVDDLEAYNLYLKGRFYWNTRTETGLAQSIDYFRQALEREPLYGRAHAGLADAYVTLGMYGARRPDEVMPAARAAALRSIEIDASLAEAHVSLAMTECLYEWEWQAAEESLRHAIELGQGYATAYHWYASNLLVPLGRFEEALTMAARARSLDPLSPAIEASLGALYFFCGRNDDAVDQLEATIELNPTFALAHFFLGQVLDRLGRGDAAHEALVRAVALSGSSPETVAAMATAQARAGREDVAKQALAELVASSRHRYVSPVLMARILVALGNREAALGRLEEACELRSCDLAWIAVQPAFASLESEARFQDLLRRVGLRTGPDSPVTGRG